MNLVEDPRAAGEIRRYHTWAVHRDQSVGEHTWQIMRILLTIWPNAPRNVVIFALMHDAGEMAGDIQYPFKNLFPELRAGSDKAEDHVRTIQRKLLGAPESKHPLSPFEHHVFKACDNLEMWEFGQREVNMGNTYAKIVVTRMNEAVSINVAFLEGLRGTKQFMDNDGIITAIHRYMQMRLTMEKFDGTE